MSSTTTTGLGSPAASPANTATEETLTWSDDGGSGPLARAFPLPHLSADALVMAGILIVSLIIRLIGLGDRPLHHDESLHATYAWYLMGRPGPEYHYDPMMHGPLQFHMMAFFYYIFGSSPFAARLWSVTCGTALVAVPWLLRRQLGRWQTFALMAMLSLSPIPLYFSRFAREDMQFALFTFLMVATIIRYIADHADGSAYYYRWLYLFGFSTGMAYAAKESIYLNVAMLGAFFAVIIGIELLRGWWIAVPVVGLALVLGGVLSGYLSVCLAGALLVGGVIVFHLARNPRSGPVSAAVRQTPWSAWAIALAPFVAVFVLLYWPIGDPPSWAFLPGSNKVATSLDIPGLAKPKPFTYSTDGLFGGLQYWQAQQPVARGGQPWFYYLMVIPLYEWLVTLFGLIGAGYVIARQRSFATILILSWTLASFAIYGWTSEKMPWNALHLVVPLACLAAIGLVAAVTSARHWLRWLAIVAAVLTGLISTHNALTLAFINGASPYEYMVYVQTTPDVPHVYDEIQRVQSHIGGPIQLKVDNDDTWPWAFYLRDTSRFTITGYPSSPADYHAPTEPVLIVSDTNYQAMKSSLLTRYVSFHERLRWWNPEEYKTYAERRDPKTNALLPKWQRLGYFLQDLVSPSTWSGVMKWEIQRTPFSPHAWDNDGNQVIFWFLVDKQYVQYLSPALQAQAQAQASALAAQNPFLHLMRSPASSHSYRAAARSFRNAGPAALDAQGNLYVADSMARHIVEISPAGTVLRRWGSPGTAPGQFNGKYAPGIGDITIGPNGYVYATDTWNGRVQEFTPGGVFVRAWGRQNLNQTNLKPDDFYGPRGIAAGPNGDIYVADTGHKRIQVFDATGHFLRGIGQAGSAIGQLNEPSSVTVDGHGHLYVADFWNSRIQAFDTASGAYVSSFVVSAWQSGGYDEPRIAVDDRGRLFLPDPAGGRMLVYSTAGKPLYGWGSGLFVKPLAVVTSKGGQVLVTDSGNNSLTVFTAP